jgi:hypothetical protein
LEMSYGTFAPLLAQPRPRLKTWRMKIGLLALALASVVIAAVLSLWLWRYIIPGVFARDGWEWLGFAYYFLVLALMAFVGGLWTTLLFRQVMTAFWFAILVPFALFNAFCALVEWLGFNFSDTISFALMACGYAVVGYCLARWLFLQAQDKPERETTDVLRCSFLPAFRKRRWPVTALLVKELRLQQGTLVIAAVLVLLHLASVAATQYLPAVVLRKYPYFDGVWIVWLLVPLLVSCCAVAEERRVRTLESALCLPVAEPLQFALKMLTVFGLGILLGAVMPWCLELLRSEPGLKNVPIKDLGLPHLLTIALILTSLGCYGSSLSGTLLQAFGTALFFGVAFVVCMSWVRGMTQAYWQILAAVSFCLSYGNFKQLRLTRRHWAGNGAIWLAVILTMKYLWYYSN